MSLINKIPDDTLDETIIIRFGDHGEAFGEFGFYAHQIGCPLPAVRNVPWVETTATETKNYEPKIKPNDTTHKNALENHLKDLGYI